MEPVVDPNNPPQPDPPKPADPPIAKVDPPASPDPEILKAERKRREDAEIALGLERNKLQALEQKNADAERKRLEEEGNYKQLAAQEREAREAADVRAAQIESDSRHRESNAEIRIALMAEGVSDPDVAMLIDRSSVKFENGRFTGITEAVKAFKEAKPHFFGKPVVSTSAAPVPPAPAKASDANQPVDVTKMKPDEYKDYRKNFLRSVGRK